MDHVSELHIVMQTLSVDSVGGKYFSVNSCVFFFLELGGVFFVDVSISKNHISKAEKTTKTTRG